MADLIPSLVLAVIPKKGFISWLQQLIATLEIQLPANEKKLDEIDLHRNCPLFLLPFFTDSNETQKFIEDNYKAIFINSLYLWFEDTRFWPKEIPDKMTYALFKEYFDLELHSRFYDLTRT